MLREKKILVDYITASRDYHNKLNAIAIAAPTLDDTVMNVCEEKEKWGDSVIYTILDNNDAIIDRYFVQILESNKTAEEIVEEVLEYGR